MPNWYERWVHQWEFELSLVDRNRRVTPFEWGWEWLRDTPIDGLPACDEDAERGGLETLRGWNHLAVERSEEFFSYEPVNDYRLEGESLRFSSPVATPWSENNQVTARWFPAAGKRAVVVLPQWNSDEGGHVGLCRIFQKVGIASLRLSLPYHDVRMPGDLRRAEYTVDPNVGRSIHAGRQAVCDVRACVDWLEQQGYTSLGIVGTSLGACYALLAAAHDRRLRTGVFNHVSMWMGEVIWTGLSTEHVRQGIEAQLDHGGALEAWRVISPGSYLRRLPGLNKKMLLIWAKYDLSFLPVFSREVIESFEYLGIDYESRVLPCGHYTTGQTPFKFLDAWYMTRFLQREL